MDVGNGDARFHDIGEETVMIGFYLCMVLAAAFLLLGFLFALAGERGANWLSGFSFLSKEERARYDRKRMAADQRNAFWLWGGVMLLGATGSRWISGYVGIGAFAVWLVLFFREVHLDTESAYGKYRLEDKEGTKESAPDGTE
nr:DUF3784 domain-containing protein [uncultured Acetatifactor sp.]